MWVFSNNSICHTFPIQFCGSGVRGIIVSVFNEAKVDRNINRFISFTSVPRDSPQELDWLCPGALLNFLLNKRLRVKQLIKKRYRHTTNVVPHPLWKFFFSKSCGGRRWWRKKAYLIILKVTVDTSQRFFTLTNLLIGFKSKSPEYPNLVRNLPSFLVVCSEKNKRNYIPSSFAKSNATSVPQTSQTCVNSRIWLQPIIPQSSITAV